jgi:Mrp family chromosome partitioning ATPase
METMEAAEYADASLLVIKSDTVLPKDAKWGLHFLENCHAECIGVVLNACI